MARVKGVYYSIRDFRKFDFWKEKTWHSPSLWLHQDKSRWILLRYQTEWASINIRCAEKMKVFLFCLKLIHSYAQSTNPSCPFKLWLDFLISPWFCSTHPHSLLFSERHLDVLKLRNSLDFIVTVKGLSYLYGCDSVLSAIEGFICHLWKFNFLLLYIADICSKWTMVHFFSSSKSAWPLSWSGCLLSALTEVLHPLKLCYIFLVAFGLHRILSLSSAATGSCFPGIEGPVPGPWALNSICIIWELRNSELQIISIISCHFSSDLQHIKWDQGQNPCDLCFSLNISNTALTFTSIKARIFTTVLSSLLVSVMYKCLKEDRLFPSSFSLDPWHKPLWSRVWIWTYC